MRSTQFVPDARLLRFVIAPLVLLALASVALAELTIDGSTKVDEYTFVKLSAKGAAEGSGYSWHVFDSAGKKVPSSSLWKQKEKLVFVGPAGTYTVELTAIRLDPKTGDTVLEEASTEVTIVGKAPPVKPVIQRFDATPSQVQKGGKSTLTWTCFPPEVKVTLDGYPVATAGTREVSSQVTTTYTLTASAGPVAVTQTVTVTVSDKPPDPVPGPAPIPVEGFRVLIVYETAEIPKLPKAQSLILQAKSVRDYLNAKCAQDPDVATWKSWRMWDKDQDTSAVSKMWQDAMKRSRASVPWIIISNHPTGGYEGPLPANVDETLALLKKYGG